MAAVEWGLPTAAETFEDWARGLPRADPVAFIVDAFKAAAREAVRAFTARVEEIRRRIEGRDFTGAMILILEVAVPAFVVFIVIDLLCTKFAGFGLELEGLRKALQSFFKVDLFVSAVVGALVGAGINSPAQQVANILFRPSLLSQSAALEAYLKGLIDRRRLEDVLARHGVPDADMDLLVDLADKKPSIAELARIYQYVDVADDKVTWLLRENLVVDPYLQGLYRRYFRALRLRDEYSVYQSALRADFADGLLTEGELEKDLREFKASTEEVEMFKANCIKMLNRKLTRMAVETAVWYYRKGLIDEKTLYSNLIRLGVRSEVANAIARLEAARKGIVWEAGG